MKKGKQSTCFRFSILRAVALFGLLSGLSAMSSGVQAADLAGIDFRINQQREIPLSRERIRAQRFSLLANQEWEFTIWLNKYVPLYTFTTNAFESDSNSHADSIFTPEGTIDADWKHDVWHFIAEFDVFSQRFVKFGANNVDVIAPKLSLERPLGLYTIKGWYQLKVALEPNFSKELVLYNVIALDLAREFKPSEEWLIKPVVSLRRYQSDRSKSSQTRPVVFVAISDKLPHDLSVQLQPTFSEYLFDSSGPLTHYENLEVDAGLLWDPNTSFEANAGFSFIRNWSNRTVASFTEYQLAPTLSLNYAW